MTSFNIFTSASWIITGFTSAILSIIFLAKNPRRRLNQLFSAGFLLWSLSMLCNGIVFTVAYRSLIAANIFRDLCVVFAAFSGVMLFIAAYGVYFGANSVNWIILVIFLVIAALQAGFGAPNDWVTIDGLGGFKTTDNLLGKILVQIVSAIFIVISDIFLFLTYRSTKIARAKQRVGYFWIGVSTIIIGLLFMVIDTFININPYIFPSLTQLAWITGPILVLIGFYVKTDETDTPSLPKDGYLRTESQLVKSDQEKKLERPSLE